MTKPADQAPINNFFGEGGGRRGAHIRGGEVMAAAHAGMRRRTPKTPNSARDPIAPPPAPTKKSEKPVCATPERLAKGDVVRTSAGFHRSLPPIERLYKAKKLGHDESQVRENLALFQAAERLKNHYDRKSAMGVRAQDLNRVLGGSGEGLAEEEAWVFHNKQFEVATKLMGFSTACPMRGSARIVIAVVCDEMAVTDAAEAWLVPERKERMLATAMEKLREGLFCLAVHWGFL